MTGCSGENAGISYGKKELTSQEKMEDFEYMYNILKENYPYFEVNKRVNGVDWLKNKEIYESRIENTKNNEDFMEELNSILSELHNGHTNVLFKKIFPIFIVYIKIWIVESHGLMYLQIKNPWSGMVSVRTL